MQTIKKLTAYVPVFMSAGALFGLYCLMGGCGASNAEPTKPQTALSADERIPVRVVQVQSKTVALPIHAAGILSSANEQRPSFKIGGVIQKIYVDEGDIVRPGQLLAILDKTEIDAQLNQAQQGLNKAERDLSRVEGLYRDSSATLELVQNATTGRDVAKETVRIAAFNRQYAEIRAAKGGKVIKKLMNEGEMTGPGNPIFVIFETGPDDWIVKINVSDRDWARLQVGMPAGITMDAYPDTRFSGKIAELAPAADPSNGLYPVEIKVAPQGKRFAPGLFAQADITPPAGRAYAVAPIEAIVEGEGKSAFVFSVQDDGESVQKIPVQVAFIDGAYAVLSNESKPLKTVITSGAPYLTEKKKVRIVQ